MHFAKSLIIQTCTSGVRPNDRRPFIAAITLLFIVGNGTLYGNWFRDTYQFTNGLSYLTPSAGMTETYGILNPAGLAYLSRPEATLALSTNNVDAVSVRDVGFWGGGGNTGLGIHYRNLSGDEWATDFSLARAFGTKTIAGGIGIGWNTASSDSLKDKAELSYGMLLRPWRRISLGASSRMALGDDRIEGIVTAGLRPTGNEIFTLKGDWGVKTNNGAQDQVWGVGFAAEPFRGLRLSARYGSDHSVFIGLNMGFGYSGVAAAGTMDTRSPQSAVTYALRIGAYEPSVTASRLNRRKRYMELDLHPKIGYRRRPFFDDGPTLLGTLRALEAARRDSSIGGVAIRASTMSQNLTFTWEIREKLRELKKAGKKVVVYIDKGRMKQYYLASVADRIVMDPQGSIALPGVLSGSTFYSGTLDKIGIEFDEWRFFKYKSGYEEFERDSMSEGAREQRAALIEDIYNLLRRGVCEGRDISTERFDSLVNNKVYFRPNDAVAAGLIDTIGRWETVEKVIEVIEGSEKKLVKPDMVAARMTPEHDYWSAPPRIAVIYALGACAMDRGIEARDLVEVIRKAGENSRVKAIVLRVDSPGGDPMASDIVAQALRECAEEKPVVVSQGSVAASGGYWLSMYGDTIVAAGPTITGSIGVIGGWVYNDGLKEKLGMTTDHVKIGKHADLPFGISLPFMGVMLPDRNLTPHERNVAKSVLLSMYDEFVGKVAEARGMDTAAVDSVAQGRIWSGMRGREKGLVDEIGGLYESIRIAADLAGIGDPVECTITEAPKKEMSFVSLVAPEFSARKARTQPVIDYLHLHMESNGQPLLLMPIELW
ncbi:MAG: signal peptide peptidase SppA [Chitinivibrionales bacterium]|nr:signal peptide peptidase SppA [Chitinivibrionales bacterium]MBD3358072.1 signal peptide peptidase SppA [Chitinivibrionales bacterium]